MQVLLSAHPHLLSLPDSTLTTPLHLACAHPSTKFLDTIYKSPQASGTTSTVCSRTRTHTQTHTHTHTDTDTHTHTHTDTHTHTHTHTHTTRTTRTPQTHVQFHYFPVFLTVCLPSCLFYCTYINCFTFTELAVNCGDNIDRSPLHYAAICNRLPAVKVGHNLRSSRCTGMFHNLQ